MQIRKYRILGHFHVYVVFRDTENDASTSAVEQFHAKGRIMLDADSLTGSSFTLL